MPCILTQSISAVVQREEHKKTTGDRYSFLRLRNANRSDGQFFERLWLHIPLLASSAAIVTGTSDFR